MVGGKTQAAGGFESTRVRLLIADDHELMRRGLAQVLSCEPDMEIVGEARDGAAAVELAIKLAPDVVLMDIEMPHLDGIAATQAILQANPAIRVVAISAYADTGHVAAMLEAGACGYLLKNTAADDVVLAVRAASSGLLFLSSDISTRVFGEYNKLATALPAQPDAPSLEALTPREQEVLKLVAEGVPSKLIALELSISIKTVEAHRHAIMQKLGLDNVPELTKFAVRAGLTSLRD
jgi:two-component system, NarL family, response regulator NreC